LSFSWPSRILMIKRELSVAPVFHLARHVKRATYGFIC
jgi:hypothetical protein